MLYDNISSEKIVDIDRILFVHIHDCEEDYTSAQAIRNGNYWELLYVEKGLADISAPSSFHTLSKAEILFRHPSETLRLHVQTPLPAKLISIGFTFSSSIPASVTEFFKSSILPMGSSERHLLRLAVTEAISCRTDAPFGAGQSAGLYLQLLLLQLIRNAGSDAAPGSRRMMEDDDLFRGIIAYMEENIAEHLTIDRICRDNLVGRSLLQKLFTENTGCGIIDYFSLLKINTAKQLIRKGTANFSRIAEQLGYSSVHYFSRQFKKITGMTPTEYAQSIPADCSHTDSTF